MTNAAANSSRLSKRETHCGMFCPRSIISRWSWIAVDRSEEALRSYRERAGGFSSLSLPGYAADGDALVYGSFYCGSLCGKSWLFVLKNSEGKWHVESAVVTSIT